MNQATNRVPPSRMSKDDLRTEAARLAEEKKQTEEQVNLLGLENDRMLQELAVLRQQNAALAKSGTTALANAPATRPDPTEGERDPVTGNLLVPPLSDEELAEQDAAIGAQYDSMMDADDKPIKAIETNRLTRLPPVSIRPSMETDERDTGLHGKIAQFEDTAVGEAPKMVEHAREIDVWAARKKQENIAFMREKVTIHIHHSSDRQADKIFSIGVNGRQWSFERNKEYTVPRYVVEGLLRAKPMTYGNEEYTMSNGQRDVRWPIQQGCRYPFAIVRDLYPKWREWMAYTMAQPD